MTGRRANPSKAQKVPNRKITSGAGTGLPPQRDSYRHGDLRHALLEAGIALARAGGPEAVVLREATRRAGVVPNAAYRHFAGREELLRAVRSASLQALAVAIEAEFAKLRRSKDPAAYAKASLRAVGSAYLKFAQTETGLFRTAFAACDENRDATDLGTSSSGGPNPFRLLSVALDRLVEAGVLPPQRRPGAEYLAWSAVHGLAMLVIDGPIRAHPRAQIDAIGERLLDMVEKGL